MAGVLAAALPASGFGYSGSAAATWARNHASQQDCSAGTPCLANDCANFVSQAMNRGGGYPLHVGNGNVGNTSNWWQAKNGLGSWVTSNTWGYARHLYTFLITDEPGGYLYGWANGTATYSYTGLNRGDVLFYDWTNDGTIDHVTMLTGTGKDPNWNPNQVGDLISQHEPERLNTWWTAYPYNPNRNYTRIRLVGIGAGN